METLDGFDEIYKNNFDRIYTFIYSISNSKSLAEDITQEAFIKAYKNINTLRSQSKISAWLNKIAYNLFLDSKRKKAPLTFPIDDDLLRKLADLKINLARETEQRMMSECIHAKLQMIPSSYRLPLLLDMQGYSNREIADILGCSLENVKIRLHRSRKKAKEILGSDCSFYYDERNVFC